MENRNDEPALLVGFAGGAAFVDELLKQVDDFSHSIWQTVVAETGNHLTRANALEQLANAIERVTNSVLSDGEPVDTQKVEAAKVQVNGLRTAAGKVRSAAISNSNKICA